MGGRSNGALGGRRGRRSIAPPACRQGNAPASQAVSKLRTRDRPPAPSRTFPEPTRVLLACVAPGPLHAPCRHLGGVEVGELDVVLLARLHHLGAGHRQMARAGAWPRASQPQALARGASVRGLRGAGAETAAHPCAPVPRPKARHPVPLPRPLPASPSTCGACTQRPGRVGVSATATVHQTPRALLGWAASPLTARRPSAAPLPLPPETHSHAPGSHRGPGNIAILLGQVHGLRRTFRRVSRGSLVRGAR
jgi:hypothetical protein